MQGSWAAGTADTWLTDDPDVSQYSQFKVPKGTQFTCMGLYNDYYAYVGAEVKNDKFVDGGAIIWGFVPVRDLKPMEQEKQPEAMDKLIGNWKVYAGGSMADDYLVFNSDGTFTAGMWDWDLDTGRTGGKCGQSFRHMVCDEVQSVHESVLEQTALSTYLGIQQWTGHYPRTGNHR